MYFCICLQKSRFRSDTLYTQMVSYTAGSVPLIVVEILVDRMNLMLCATDIAPLFWELVRLKETILLKLFQRDWIQKYVFNYSQQKTMLLKLRQ